MSELRVYLVTVLDRGYRVTVEVEAVNSTGARNAALELHPGSRIVTVERTGERRA